MRFGRSTPVIAACLLLAGGIGYACGDGGTTETNAPDLSAVPTATLPASLPEPQIIGGGAVQPGGGNTYTVRDGDTLATIAERLGVTLEALRNANPGIDPGALRVGDPINLPSDAAAPPPATATPEVPEDEPTQSPAPTEAPAATNTPSSLGQTYTVKSGDIPETIAAQFGITVEALLAANPTMDPRNLQVGQVLIIPVSAEGEQAPEATPAT